MPARGPGRRAAEVGVGTLERAPGLAERLLEGAADRHHLAHGLHRRGQLRVGLGELLEREPRHLHHDVVERRLERGERHAGDVVGDLVERVPDREQRRDLGDREPRRLRGQRGRTRDARVHLDQDLAAGPRVDRELDVRAAGLDPDRADARERRIAHPLVLAVGQRHHRRHRDRVAGVHAHRVDVLDRADHDGVVRAVAHHLELELLPAGDRLLDEDLGHRARGEAAARDALELGPGAGEPAPAPAEGERRPDDQRVPELVPELERPVERTRGPRARRLEPGPAHRLLEAAAVLGAVDRLEPRSDQADPQPLEVAGLRERDRDVQRGLAAERREQHVRSFALDHLQDRSLG